MYHIDSYIFGGNNGLEELLLGFWSTCCLLRKIQNRIEKKRTIFIVPESHSSTVQQNQISSSRTAAQIYTKATQIPV